MRAFSIDQENWMSLANCLGADPDMFFITQEITEKGVIEYDAEEDKVEYIRSRFCGKCAVQSQCLDFALTHGEQGIWGGTTTKERNVMRKARR